MFQGSIVALVTPMTPTGEIDELSLKQLIEWHIKQGTDGIVVVGTTGESPTLSDTEKQRIIKLAVETAQGRIPIIAGTGSNSTLDTIFQTEQAASLGVDACLIIAPYYNRPTQEGIYQHFKAIAESVSIPIILYNHPGRTGCDILPGTLDRLMDFQNIIGLKDATGDLARGKELVALCKNKISLYSGVDENALAFMLQGGHGVISVTANIAPKKMKEMCAAALESNIGVAGKLNASLMELHKTLSLETNPTPVKWALKQMDKIQDGIRLPLLPLSEEFHEVVKDALIHSGVIECVL